MTGVSEEDAIRFSEYLDGEMNPEERAAFERELAGDEALRAALDEFRSTLGVLGTLATPAPVDLADGVKARIRRRSRGRYFGRNSAYRERVQTEVFVAVALAMLLAAVLFASPRGLEALFGTPELVLVDDGSGAPDPANPTDEDTGGTSDPDAHRGAPGLDPGADPEAEQGRDHEPLPMDGSLARAGTLGDEEVLPIAHREWSYRVHTQLDRDALRARLVEQFGPGAVSEADGRLRVAVPRADVPATLERVGDLGTVRRELSPAPGDRRTLDIVFEARQ